jgi:hypothetical protein
MIISKHKFKEECMNNDSLIHASPEGIKAFNCRECMQEALSWFNNEPDNYMDQKSTGEIPGFQSFSGDSLPCEFQGGEYIVIASQHLLEKHGLCNRH